MKLVITCAVLAILAITGIEQIESAKILAVFPFPGRSQYIFAESYLKNLAARGHEVTVINTFKTNEKVKNYRVIAVTKIHDLLASMPLSYDDWSPSTNHWKFLQTTEQFLNIMTVFVLEDPIVQELLKSGEKFDLVISETCQNEALYGLAQHFDALQIGVSSFGADIHVDELVSNISPLSYNPVITSSRTDRMNFCERLENLWHATVIWVYKRTAHLSEQERIYNKYFPNATVTLNEAVGRFSLMLLGQHFTLSYPRSYLPNMIEVGGLHLDHETKPLPADIESFITEATHGVIYFSMGSNVRSADFPADTLNTLLKTFGTLKQRVLWKFENENLPGKPDNVFISKWFPQPDILAHPNVKLFITHGGLLSTIESIYHGKAVLGLPVMYDQFLNVNRAKKAGFGLGLDLKQLNVQLLTDTINKMLTDLSYANMAKTMSARFRDQPTTAMERAIFWTEYVLRHNGAPHMRATAKDLNFIQLHSLDTIATLFGGSALIVFLVIAVICKLVKRFTGKHTSNKKRKTQ